MRRKREYNLNELGHMEYKGYQGSLQCESDAAGIVNAFHSAVDDYLLTCKKVGKEPNKTDFNIDFTDKELEQHD